MSPAQATEVSYEFHSLGWKAFQDLCVTIIADVLGQTVQNFLPSWDGGRDGAFHGIWDPGEGVGCTGSFTVQCKFSSKEENLTLTGIADEVEKARRLAERNLTNNYILMTNMGVSGHAEEKIREEFLSIEGINFFILFGRDWLTRIIRESARLRMLVPRVYGLGDLSQILDERAYAQGVEILSSLGDDLSKFVVTHAHTSAAKALVKYGFVLLLGEPAAGKSTIAASLSIGALDLWGISTLKIRNADEFVHHWNPNEPRQFFWVDDAFGATQYQRELAHEWNRVFPHLTAAIRKGARVLFTSRDYIYRSARPDLKEGAFPLIKESQVVINVQHMQSSEKEQILYNHIKLGEQLKDFKTQIKPFLTFVSRNTRFLPEIARRLGNPLFTRSLSHNEESIRRFVEEPIEFLIEVVSKLDPQSGAALALVFMRGGALESPIELTEQEQKALDTLGVDLASARKALNALNSSLILLVQSSGAQKWTFKHPTVGDAYATIVAEDPELLDIYITWTSMEKLIAEVTCGRVELEGVKVVVPESRFEVFLDRLNEVGNARLLHTFLATRCSRSFLELYLAKCPEIGDAITEPNSYLHAASEVDVLGRLFELNILPEAWRKRFVRHAKVLAIETPDVDFLSLTRIRELFQEHEIEEILHAIREELLPSFSDVVSNWLWNCDREEDPEEEFSLLVDVIDWLAIEFEDDSQTIELIKGAQQEIEAAILSLWEQTDPTDEAPDYSFAGEPRSSETDERSVFEDVDE